MIQAMLKIRYMLVLSLILFMQIILLVLAMILAGQNLLMRHNQDISHAITLLQMELICTMSKVSGSVTRNLVIIM